MKYDIVHPIVMTIIAIGNLKSTEQRDELLNGDLFLWFVLIVFVATWINYFIQISKKRSAKNS